MFESSKARKENAAYSIGTATSFGDWVQKIKPTSTVQSLDPWCSAAVGLEVCWFLVHVSKRKTATRSYDHAQLLTSRIHNEKKWIRFPLQSHGDIVGFLHFRFFRYDLIPVSFFRPLSLPPVQNDLRIMGCCGLFALIYQIWLKLGIEWEGKTLLGANIVVFMGHLSYHEANKHLSSLHILKFNNEKTEVSFHLNLMLYSTLRNQSMRSLL